MIAVFNRKTDDDFEVVLEDRFDVGFQKAFSDVVENILDVR